MVAFIFALPCDYFFVAFCGIDYTASGKGKDSVAACFILAGTGSEPLEWCNGKSSQKIVPSADARKESRSKPRYPLLQNRASAKMKKLSGSVRHVAHGEEEANARRATTQSQDSTAKRG